MAYPYGGTPPPRPGPPAPYYPPQGADGYPPAYGDPSGYTSAQGNWASPYDQPPPPPPAYGAAPPTPSHRKRNLTLAVVAVLAIVVILVLLSFSGVLPFLPGSGPSSKSSTSGGPTGLTYHQAENIANSTATSRGGSWQVAFAEAIDPGAALAPDFSTEPCALSGYSPAGTSLIGTGMSFVWGFEYYALPFSSTTWAHALFIVVANSTGNVTTQADPASSCPGITYPAGALLPSDLYDSVAPAAKAQALGGSGFLSTYPTASLSESAYFVPSGSFSSYVVWDLAYSVGSCASATSAITQFTVLFGGTNLTLLSHGWSNESCGVAQSSAYPVSFGSPVASTSPNGGVYYDNLTISAPAGLTTEYLGLSVLESNRTLVPQGSLPFLCIPPGAIKDCQGPPGSGSWDAFLVQNGTIIAGYAGVFFWDTTSYLSLASSQKLTLEIVSGKAITGTGDLLDVYSSESGEVHGSAVL